MYCHRSCRPVQEVDQETGTRELSNSTEQNDNYRDPSPTPQQPSTGGELFSRFRDIVITNQRRITSLLVTISKQIKSNKIYFKIISDCYSL